ncbi:MAG TPA: hypothetical protein VFK05_10900 [Polyangiaceae bacterium]|nr:hypothetical protein [Polyangiaceae bacterium]
MQHVYRSLSSLVVVTGLLHTMSAHAQAPTPFEIASQLDLECRHAEGAPPAQQLGIRQLNPVLQGVLPNQQAQLGPLEEVCVPVAKNNQIPSEPARSVIRGIDLACYKADAAPVNVPVLASHLNPVFANLPPEFVHLVQLQQVCVPVAKNGVIPPEPMLSVIRHMDFGCYGLEQPTSDANTNVLLSHLNPVLIQQGLPPHAVHMERARQMCVPIGKNQEPIPAPALSRVRWVDFLKYRITPVVGPLAPWPLTLSHLNPLFAERPPFNVTLFGPPNLLVPIAKNGVIPPGAGAGD